MLRRTVTVGTQYALHIWTIFLFVLATLVSLFMLSAMLDWDSFEAIAVMIIIYCIAGITVSVYALSRIKDVAQQIKDDLAALLTGGK